MGTVFHKRQHVSISIIQSRTPRTRDKGGWAGVGVGVGNELLAKGYKVSVIR